MTQQYIKQTFVVCQTDVDDSTLLIIILLQSLAKNKPQPLNIMQLCCPPQLAHTVQIVNHNRVLLQVAATKPFFLHSTTELGTALV